jgi:hypothetical protein
VLLAQTASLVSRNAHDAQRARTGYPKGPGTEVQHGCPWPDAGSAPEEPACQARPPVGVLPASGMSQGRYPCVRSESPPGERSPGSVAGNETSGVPTVPLVPVQTVGTVVIVRYVHHAKADR